jgi:hypothetical protein
MAPQLMGTKGPARRALRDQMARAASSLPDPVSPWISTGASLRAIFSIWRISARTPSEVPMGNEIAIGARP